MLKDNPLMGILVATHVKELVQQNHDEFLSLWPGANVGIYSAGIGRKDIGYPITFCGIHSIYKKANHIPKVHVLIIDEAHTIPHSGDGMWRTFIADLLKINPNLIIIGLTATDYRMQSGMLTEGDGKLFTDVVYEYSIKDAIDEGYLAPVVPQNTATTYDISSVEKRGGEYIAGQLERVYDVDEKTKSAINEIILAGENRKGWIIFASGNKHAASIHEELKLRGISGGIITQDTDDTERDELINAFKDLRIRYLVNNNILTTGFNARHVDLVACLRPTQSPGLWVQMVGRGMRTYNDKQNCLVLDFGRNTDRHGPIDKIKCKKKYEGKGMGDAPTKVCPKCEALCFAGCSDCPDCGFTFPKDEVNITKTASTQSLISQVEPPTWYKVYSVKYQKHEKPNKPPSMKVTYQTMAGNISEWVCFEHSGFAFTKARLWHIARAGNVPMPKTIDRAINRAIPYLEPSRILVQKNGKFFEIKDFDFTQQEPEKKTENEEEYFEIPF